MKLSKLKDLLDSMVIYNPEYTKMKWKNNIYVVNKTLKLDKEVISTAKKFTKYLTKYSEYAKYKYPESVTFYKIIKITLKDTEKIIYTKDTFKNYIMLSLIDYFNNDKSPINKLVNSTKDLRHLRFTLLEYIKRTKDVKSRREYYQNLPLPSKTNKNIKDDNKVTEEINIFTPGLF
jgi:hypothetical protein